MSTHYDIFISYKRKSLPTANDLHYRLSTRGYSTFYDIEEMGRGNFNTQLLNHIENAKDVFVILEEGSLDACKSDDWEKDWFCHEIAFALEKKKNIIPILLNGYTMPSEDFFPDELKELSLKHAPEFNFSFFETYLDKLVEKKYITSEIHIQNKVSSFFKFYSNEKCQVYKDGKLVCSLEGESGKPFYLPIPRKGDYRFNCINALTEEPKEYREHIDSEEEKIVEIEWEKRKDSTPDLKQLNGLHVTDLYISVDSDCQIVHKDFFFIDKGKKNILKLEKGRHELRFINRNNPEIFDDCVIDVDDTMDTDYIQMSLLEKEDEYYESKGYSILGKGESTISTEAVKAMESNANFIKISGSVTTIEDNTFEHCVNIKTLVVPCSVISIGKNAFDGLKYVIYDGKAEGAPWGALSVNGYKEDGFIFVDNQKSTILGYIGDDRIVTIPNTVTIVDHCAFNGCCNIVSIDFPKSVVTINDKAFVNCSGLLNIQIPHLVTEISPETFKGCTGLKDIILPDGLIKIGNGAFRDCKSLKTIVIPKSVKHIGRDAFFGCDNLETIRLLNPYTEYHKFKEPESLFERISNSVGKLFLGGNSFPDWTEIIIG